MPTTSDLQESSVARAFDGVAGSFEASLENDITRKLRQRIYSMIHDILPTGSTILDINCGIGIDAVNLAKLGYSVTGVDLAPKMIEQARRRAGREEVEVSLAVASFEDLSCLTGQSFDLVLSNFGGLNCVSGLDRVAAQIAAVNRSRGYFLAVVMPPLCLWEIVAGLARLDIQSGFRRLRKNVLASGFRGGSFPVFYYSPDKFIKSFSSQFDIFDIRAVNVISPPPHAMTFRNNHQHLCSFLEKLEKRCATLPLIRSMGDHNVIVLQRKASLKHHVF